MDLVSQRGGLTLLLFLLSGDIEVNPGPDTCPIYVMMLYRKRRGTKRDKTPYFAMDPAKPGYTDDVPVLINARLRN